MRWFPIVPFLVISNAPDKEAFEFIDIKLSVALIEKILEMLATIPELDAISKKASGVVSPNPNLPREDEEKTAKAEPVLS